MSDWADERAEAIVAAVLKGSAKYALAFTAATLRLTKEEGVGEGLRRVSELPFFKGDTQDGSGRAAGPEAMTAQTGEPQPQAPGKPPRDGQIKEGV